jgi:hypothetical protein
MQKYIEKLTAPHLIEMILPRRPQAPGQKRRAMPPPRRSQKLMRRSVTDSRRSGALTVFLQILSIDIYRNIFVNKNVCNNVLLLRDISIL